MANDMPTMVNLDRRRLRCGSEWPLPLETLTSVSEFFIFDNLWEDNEFEQWKEWTELR